MPRFSIIGFSYNYSKKTHTLWFDYKDEATNIDSCVAKGNLKAFKYKAKILRSTVTNIDAATIRISKTVTKAVLLKYLRNFEDYLKCHCLIAK